MGGHPFDRGECFGGRTNPREPLPCQTLECHGFMKVSRPSPPSDLAQPSVGSTWLPPRSPVAAGDYATGGNHVLPTDGWARSLGGLGLETFMKPVTFQRLTREGLARVRPTAEALAAVEGMPAHAAAMRR